MTTAIETQAIGQARPNISHSQISTYGQCSLKWWLSRNYLPEHTPSALAFGRAFHSGLEKFYAARLEGREATAEDMLAAYDKEVALVEAEEPPIQYGKKETKESLRETAERMFLAFLESVKPSTVLAVEEPFRVNLDEDLPVVLGYIDLIQVVEVDEGRAIEVVDFKSAAKKPGEDGLPADQLIAYHLAVQNLRMLSEFDAPVKLLYRVVTKTKSPECLDVPVEPTPHEEDRLITKAKACVQGMESGIVFPNPSWSCSTCQFKSHCALWPDLDAIKASFPAKHRSSHTA